VKNEVKEEKKTPEEEVPMVDHSIEKEIEDEVLAIPFVHL